MARLRSVLFAFGTAVLSASAFPAGNVSAEWLPADGSLGSVLQEGFQEGITDELALIRLEGLLASSQENDPKWRRRIWIELQRLEFGPKDKVLPGWEALARSGSDQDLANLLLYQRRHSLPLTEPSGSEGPESTLERCLYLWGQKLIPATRQALADAIGKFPADGRFLDNLHWLSLSSPNTLPFDGRPRDLALAVLAARQAHH